MNRYVIEFSKQGYIKYTSHLDMLRLFKRAFKKSGVPIAYSQGFNPHPKMGFAQPLSLGYTSICELIEFETTDPISAKDTFENLEKVMPSGIILHFCIELKSDIKSLAAEVEEATYKVSLPVRADSADFNAALKGYMNQPSIMAEKRQKKTKKMVSTDIKSKIRSINAGRDGILTLFMTLDSGSTSNLSPEQVIASFLEFTGLKLNRDEIEVEREKINFRNNLKF